MCEPLLHKVKLKELGNTVESIHDGILKSFENVHVDTLFVSEKCVQILQRMNE